MLLCSLRSTGHDLLSKAGPSRACYRSLTTATTSARPSRPLRVLGLESSADDACAAVVTSSREILSNIVLKQHHINLKYGGIHPIKAQEAHMLDMPTAIQRALDEAGILLSDVDAVAYTRGPGMFGCLTVGVTSARALAAAAHKPLVGVHHMQAHALTPLLTEPDPPAYPFLTLLVSGGHTQLVYVRSLSSFQILMTSMDNSIGDAFDKIARLLQLPPSPTHGLGPVLEKYASDPAITPFDTNPLEPLKLPLSTNRTKSQLAFSFAGLLTATERLAKSVHSNLKMKIPLKVQREVSRAFQTAVVAHVVAKVRACMTTIDEPIHGLVVSGGVGSNLYLRDQLRRMLEDVARTSTPSDSSSNSSDGPRPIPLFYPPVSLCTDNAAMIAWTAILRLEAGLVGESYNLPVRKKWSLEDLYNDVPLSSYRQEQGQRQEGQGQEQQEPSV